MVTRNQVEDFLKQSRETGNDYNERQCEIVLCRTIRTSTEEFYAAGYDQSVAAALKYIESKVSA